MSKSKPIHYEPHPVSQKRKAELLAQGVKIIDAVFAPAGQAEKAAKLTVEELRTVLTEAGVEFDPKAKKADLQALFEALPPADPAEGQE